MTHAPDTRCRPTLGALLAEASRGHARLCPRHVLGVRIGLAGARAVHLDAPRADKRLLVVAETDGCFLSGVTAATGCRVDRRTLRVLDWGKVAATFVDVETERTARVLPKAGCRERAAAFAPGAASPWHAMRSGYQSMPDELLLDVERVRLRRPVAEIVSRPGLRVPCVRCGEEIMNEREVAREGATVCRACAGDAHWETLADG